MKKLIIFLVFSLLGITLSFAQGDKKSKAKKIKPHYILIDIYEVPRYEKKGIFIHYGENNTVNIPFNEFKKENHEKNGELLTKTLNDLYEDGYRVTSMSSGAWKRGKITKVIMEYVK